MWCVFVLLDLIGVRALFVAPIGEVDEDSCGQSGEHSDDWSGEGEDRAKESPCQRDGFFAGLWGGDGEGSAGAFARALVSQAGSDRDHGTRAEREWDAQEGGFDEGDDALAAEVLEHPFAGDEYMDDAGEEEPEEEPKGRFGEDHPELFEKSGHRQLYPTNWLFIP